MTVHLGILRERVRSLDHSLVDRPVIEKVLGDLELITSLVPKTEGPLLRRARWLQDRLDDELHARLERAELEAWR